MSINLLRFAIYPFVLFISGNSTMSSRLLSRGLWAGPPTTLWMRSTNGSMNWPPNIPTWSPWLREAARMREGKSGASFCRTMRWVLAKLFQWKRCFIPRIFWIEQSWSFYRVRNSRSRVDWTRHQHLYPKWIADLHGSWSSSHCSELQLVHFPSGEPGRLWVHPHDGKSHWISIDKRYW